MLHTYVYEKKAVKVSLSPVTSGKKNVIIGRMNTIELYPKWEPAGFVERLNRFVMQLKKEDGQVITAYVANPGRMEEFLTPGHPFFITPGNEGKYYYRVVSTSYRDSYVLLDTIKINAVVEKMLKNGSIAEFRDYSSIRREYAVNRSKFDFLLEAQNKKPVLLEIKSCSLCHNGVAMFPDAPTKRGKRHLEDLELLTAQGYDCYTLYLVNHKHAHVFMPNGHTDPEYCQTFNRSKNIRFLAYSINLTDPVTLDLSFLKEVPIDHETTAAMCKDRGSYLLVFYNDTRFVKSIGALGEREFKKGYYVYVGSAMQGLEKRIKRHLRKTKNVRWHLDHISPALMKADKAYPIRRGDKIEEGMAQRLMEICDDFVPGFGSSDSCVDSHFFYFSDRPYRRREFLDILLDARHSTF